MRSATDRRMGRRLALVGSLAALIFVACAKDRFADPDDTSGGTGYQPTAESGPEACADGVDNDNDGWIDCVDLDCQPGGEPNPSCVPDGQPEADDNRCADGIDNDENGFKDCADFSCSDNPDVTVCPSEDSDDVCDDEIDNDGNGFTDCDDFSCSMNPMVTVCGGGGTGGMGPEDNAAACSDNVDNDGDTFIDCVDFDCDAFCM
jgi:hypothetical protein